MRGCGLRAVRAFGRPASSPLLSNSKPRPSYRYNMTLDETGSGHWLAGWLVALMPRAVLCCAVRWRGADDRGSHGGAAAAGAGAHAVSDRRHCAGARASCASQSLPRAHLRLTTSWACAATARHCLPPRQNCRLKGIVVYSYCVGQQIGAPLPLLLAIAAAPVGEPWHTRACALSWLVTERIVSLALPDKKYEHNQSSLYKVRCLGRDGLVRHAMQPS